MSSSKFFSLPGFINCLQLQLEVVNRSFWALAKTQLDGDSRGGRKKFG